MCLLYNILLEKWTHFSEYKILLLNPEEIYLSSGEWRVNIHFEFFFLYLKDSLWLICFMRQSFTRSPISQVYVQKQKLYKYKNFS